MEEHRLGSLCFLSGRTDIAFPNKSTAVAVSPVAMVTMAPSTPPADKRGMANNH